MKFRKYNGFLAAVLMAAAVFASCGDSKEDESLYAQQNKLVSNLIVPSTTFYTSGMSQITIQGRGFEANDTFTLNSKSEAKELSLEIVEIENGYVTFAIPASLATGEYLLTLHRGDRQQVLGTLKFRESMSLEVADKAGATVKGVVFCGKEPVVGAVVSDGVEITTTDDNGHYWLDSDKYHGYVFVTLPSGYEPLTDASLPDFWRTLGKAADQCEQVNFELVKVDNDDHIMLAIADIQISNRNGDLNLFKNDVIPDLKMLANSYSSKRVYAMNLGDMTWDAYWYSGKYGMPQYVSTMKSHNLPFPIFHTPGNHDNDPYVADDFGAEAAYKANLGPTYFSFNIGKVHYIMLDNNVFVNKGASQGVVGDRTYNKYITKVQLDWLKKDLALVDASTPLVIGMHCPLHYYTSSFEMKNAFSSAIDSKNLLDCLAGFENVHFLSGHTHYNANYLANESPTMILEHNTAAACATWWWTSYYNKGSVCKDGSPGGYAVYEVSGDQIKWYYKGLAKEKNQQFRTYDMNMVKNYFKTNADAQFFLQYFPNRNDYVAVGSNVTFINVWNWDPKWTIEVKEGSVDLEVKRIAIPDPLHTICYDIPRVRATGGTLTTDFQSTNTTHMFYVTASSPSTSLSIKVTDRFGNVYTENMARPKEYSVNMN